MKWFRLIEFSSVKIKLITMYNILLRYTYYTEWKLNENWNWMYRKKDDNE